MRPRTERGVDFESVTIEVVQPVEVGHILIQVILRRKSVPRGRNDGVREVGSLTESVCCVDVPVLVAYWSVYAPVVNAYRAHYKMCQCVR